MIEKIYLFLFALSLMILRGGVCVVISFGCSSLFDLFLSAQSLFPGLWLSGVTIDAYKVPESAENGKVIAFFESVLFLFGWLGNSKHVKFFHFVTLRVFTSRKRLPLSSANFEFV